jgi:hypothetical protein
MPCDVKSSFKTGLQISLNHTDFHIPFDKNWFSCFKSEITSFWILKFVDSLIYCNPVRTASKSQMDDFTCSSFFFYRFFLSSPQCLIFNVFSDDFSLLYALMWRNRWGYKQPDWCFDFLTFYIRKWKCAKYSRETETDSKWLTLRVIKSSVAWWKLFMSKWQTRVLNILSPIRWLLVVLDIREAAVLKVEAKWLITGSGSSQGTGKGSWIELLGSEASIGNESYSESWDAIGPEVKVKATVNSLTGCESPAILTERKLVMQNAGLPAPGSESDIFR